MKTTVTGAALLLTAAAAAGAVQLSPHSALRQALGHPCAASIPALSAGTYRLEMTAPRGNAYCFNNTSGDAFLIVSSEEDAPCPVLGYGSGTAIDRNHLPDGLRWFLENASGPGEAATGGGLEDLAPIVMSRWDQGDPYNRDCPVQNGRTTFTGCVATAMAQVIYHHTNRMQPSGSYSYQWPSMTTELSFDYDASPFDYGAMLAEYRPGEYSEEAADAVANFCKGVGVACNMDYGWMASGCSQYDAADALRFRLGCDNGVAMLLRDFYDAHEWAQIVHASIAADYPVLYIGVSTAGGHAFIADGYQGQAGDYFHINWGWGGMSDGYFLLSALLPEKLGTGGGSGHTGFNDNQMAFIGLKPAEEGSLPAPTIYMTGVFDAEYTDDSREYVSFECGHGLSYTPGMFSYALDGFNGALALEFTDTATGEVSYSGQTEDLEWQVWYGYLGMTVPVSALPESGTYTVRPVLVRGGETYPIVQDITTRNVLTMDCSGDRPEFSSADVGHRVVAENLRLASTEIVRSRPLDFGIDLRAQHVDYNGGVRPVLINGDGGIAAKMSSKGVDLADGETAGLEWSEKFVPAVPEGLYLFTLLNDRNEMVLEGLPVTVVKTASACEIADSETASEYFGLGGLRMKSPAPGQVTVLRRNGKAVKSLGTALP